MSLRNSNQGFFSYLVHRIELDRFAMIILTMLVTLLAVFSLLSGVVIWPVVFSGHSESPEIVSLLTALKYGGLVTIILDLVVSASVMLVSRKKFSFVRVLLINLLMGWVVFMLFICTHNEVLSTVGVEEFNGKLMWFCFAVMGSYMLSVLPAVIAAGLAKLAHTILDSVL